MEDLTQELLQGDRSAKTGLGRSGYWPRQGLCLLLSAALVLAAIVVAERLAKPVVLAPNASFPDGMEVLDGSGGEVERSIVGERGKVHCWTGYSSHGPPKWTNKPCQWGPDLPTGCVLGVQSVRLGSWRPEPTYLQMICQNGRLMTRLMSQAGSPGFRGCNPWMEDGAAKGLNCTLYGTTRGGDWMTNYIECC